MLRIRDHKAIWRLVILVLLLAALMGPWFFDRINVPSEYVCSAPNIRLEGDFCGVPASGLYILFAMVTAPISNVVGLITGTMGLPHINDVLQNLLLTMGALLLLSPFFSTPLMFLRGDRPRLRLIHLAALILAAGIGLLYGLNNHPRYYWVLWGSWVYAGIAISTLILELPVLVAGRRPSQG
jgi:hypothetical protein